MELVKEGNTLGVMNSKEICQAIADWAQHQNFTAPYGVLSGQYVNKKGKKVYSVTFGYARTLDATVEIYNRNFIVFRTSATGSEVFKSYNELMVELTKRYSHIKNEPTI